MTNQAGALGRRRVLAGWVGAILGPAALTVALTPLDQGVAVVNARMHNVPAKIGKDWPLRTPGNARTEQFFYR